MAGARGLVEAVLAAAQLDDQLARVHLEIGTATPMRFTTWWPQYVDTDPDPDETYTSRGMKIGAIVHDTPATTRLQIDIDDTDRALYLADRSEELTSLDASLTIQVLGAGGSWRTIYSCTWPILDGVCGKIGMSYSITIGPGGGKHPRHCGVEGSRNCPNDFGGPRCQFAPTETYPQCSKTWDDCVLRSNTEHFNGARRAAEAGEVIKFVTDSGQVVYQHTQPPSNPPSVSAPRGTFSEPVGPGPRRPHGRPGRARSPLGPGSGSTGGGGQSS